MKNLILFLSSLWFLLVIAPVCADESPGRNATELLDQLENLSGKQIKKNVFQDGMNAYLQRDYKKLTEAGVQVKKRLFTLADMVVKFDEMKEEHGPLLALHDYINIAKEGNEVAVKMALEFVPGVEHFANYKNQQVFLMVDFSITLLGKTHHYERCLACYEADKEQQEKPQKIDIANERLKILFDEFDQVSIKYEKRFFE